MDDSIVLPDLPTYLFTPSLASVLSLILAVLLPLAAALLMKQSWSALRKGLILLALSAFKGYVEAWLAATNADLAFNHVTTLYAVLVNFGIAVVAYFGLLKGTDVQKAALRSGVKDRVIDGQAYPTRR